MNKQRHTLALLACLLLPFSMCWASTKSRIEQLRRESLVTAQKLKEIGDQIVSCYAFFDSCGEQYHDVIERIMRRTLGDDHDDETKEEQLKKELETKAKTLSKDLERALQGKILFEYDLTNEFFRDINNVSGFDKLKFFYMKATTDSYLLIRLVEEYQTCLQKLIDINKELILLTQED